MHQPLATYTSGVNAPVPADNIVTYLFSNPCQHATNDWSAPSTSGHANPAHSFQGQTIAPQRPALVHAATGASISWERVRLDALKVARGLRAVVGEELVFDGRAGKEPIHSPRTTVLICLPNCAAFACVTLGSLAALCTVTTASPLQTPTELAVVLAKARPQVIVAAAGADGEGRIRSALDIVLQGQHSRCIHDWAQALAADWDASNASKYSKGELQPPHARRRIWTVTVHGDRAADYYGSGARPDGVAAQADPRDWTHLLQPPPGHKHAGTLDQAGRDAFMIRPLTKDEQRRRVALLLWSSGTTGAPKGVLLSHENLVASVMRTWTNLTCLRAPVADEGETWVALAPWTHIMGLALILLPAFIMGATLVIPPTPRFSLPVYLATIARYRATYLHVAPPIVTMLANLDTRSAGSALASVRGMASGGAPTSVATVRRVYDQHRIPVHLGYGASEAGYIAHAAAESYQSDDTAALMELGSVGVPGANMEIKISPIPGCDTKQALEARRRQILEHVIADHGKEAGNGHRKTLANTVPGEICLRGPSIMLGYFSGHGSEESTEGGQRASSLDVALSKSALDEDGWYHTGDEGCLDISGQLWIVGRLKELIKVKGYQVSPVELDATFAKHPDVADVAATGTASSAHAQEQVCLYVVPRETQAVLSSDMAQRALADRLISYIAEHAAHYKWPSVYIFCEAIPKNPTGKILRRELHKLPGTRHLAKEGKSRTVSSRL